MQIQDIDYSADILGGILWQYSQATNLLSLINQKQEWYLINQSLFWSNWYATVFNLSSVNLSLFGTAVWSIILNVPLLVPIHPESPDKPNWGFNAFDPSFPDYENSYTNFSYGNFSTHNQNGHIDLTLAQQQFLLRLRYFQLTTRGDVIDINNFLNYLCTTSDIGFTGSLYALDGLNMTMTYVFTDLSFPAGLWQAIYYGGLDILPRPATVGERLVFPSTTSWGFNAFEPAWPDLENHNTNFSSGNFYSGVF